MLKNFLVMFLFVVGLTGCVTRGVDFSSDLSWVKVNSTTQMEVSQKLGTPYSVGNSGGLSTWTYGYYKYALFTDSPTKELKFYWSNDHKVKDFSFTSSFPEDRRTMSPLNAPSPASSSDR